MRFARLFRNKTCAIALAVLALVLGGGPARAGMDQTWVAAEGQDSGMCLIYLPCATLAFALDQTSTGGTINVIDSGYYGTVTVNKAITIRSELGNPAMIASITIDAGASDKVMISGIDLQGTAQSYGIAYPYGIYVKQAADVLIHNVRIKDYNASGTVGAGLYINSAGQTRVTINETLFYNNKVGTIVTSQNGNAHLKAYRSLYVANSDAGVRVIGKGNDVIVADNNIVGSPKSMDLQNGGAAKSFGNNSLTSGDVPAGMTMY